MTKELAQSYEHTKLEEEIYQFWEKNGFFRPEKQIELGLVDKDHSESFCITIPLPNVTGQLHLGHALTISLEDLMTRFERMNYNLTLFTPGTDHAGIATQNVVERELLKQGIKRKEIGREKFIEKVWEWKEKYHARITEQSKRMGMSSDWSRERFTLDEVCTKAVREAFYRLYKKGLIYRGEYMVNWCPRCESAISDLESIPEEKPSNLWYIKYPISDKKWKKPSHKWGSGNWAKGASKFIVVATTRPETLLGDTAVAITPEHKEYKSFIGKKAVLPVNGRKIPIIADDYVDPEFGTGALKITPGHDPNDFELGKKHNLEFINILDEKAFLLPEHSGKYAGMEREEARDAIVEDLQKEGLLLQIEEYTHSEPHCQRCKTIIEPRISIQWFVKTEPLAEAAMKEVREGRVTILPEREEKRFFQWMENIHDWCISRQLWWGHQIPIWYCEDCSEEICPLPNVNEVSECPKCSSKNVTQEEDVLDTWFSSGLWPFSTNKWPDTDHPDFKQFYPTTTRETGYDILFFWVARELMLGIELTGEAPYKNVYLHGIIRDEKGRKISKSMEDVEQYDPLHIISEHGADSLRFLLISNSLPGTDFNLDPRQLDAAHRFCNKIWQSTRFLLGNFEDKEKLIPITELNTNNLTYSDRWILSRLHSLIESVTNSYQNFDYLSASRDIKNFYWNEFCDWYIEISKIRVYSSDEKDRLIPKTILLHVLKSSLKLLHPIIPFMTEKLWQYLPEKQKNEKALIIAKWPEIYNQLINKEIEEGFQFSIDLIKELRRIRAEFGIPLSKQIPLKINPGSYSKVFEDTKSEIITLAKIDENELEISAKLSRPKRAARIVLSGIEGYIPLENLIDLKKEVNKIQIKLNKIIKNIGALKRKLDSPFAQRAPKEIVDKEKENLADLENKKKQLEEQLEIFN